MLNLLWCVFGLVLLALAVRAHLVLYMVRHLEPPEIEGGVWLLRLPNTGWHSRLVLWFAKRRGGAW